MAVHRVSDGSARAVVDASVGDEIVVTLAEMAGAGYQWQFQTAVPPALEVLPEGAASPASAAPGASHSRQIRLRITAAGETRLELSHRREWEDASSASKHFSLTVRAT